jgi:hypothetical protein
MNMEASSSGHPAPEALLAFGDGEAPAEVVVHVATCSTCAAQAADYAHAQNELERALYRFDCPSAQTLGEYNLDLLDPARRVSVAAHARDCEACAAELQTLRAYLAESGPDVPESLVGRARRVVATLFAPSPELAFGGLRGGAADATRETRVFNVEDVTITIGPGHAERTMLGLVVAAGRPAESLAGRQVRLLPLGRPPRTTTLDDVGNFEFADVPSGACTLELDLPDALVVVEDLLP